MTRVKIFAGSKPPSAEMGDKVALIVNGRIRDFYFGDHAVKAARDVVRR